jgi:CRISPR-associated protein Csx14
VNDLRLRMDPLNPGQFFACCGLLELIELERPGALSRFDLDSGRPRVAEFSIQVEPDSSTLLGTFWNAFREAGPEFPDEGIDPPVRPAVIPYGGSSLTLDWWLDEFRDKTQNLKCWAGQVTTRNLVSELLPLLDPESSGDDLFERARMTKAKFGVDPRSAWNTLDFGFSPNEHGRDAATFPAVEILAAIGLQGFRPDATRREGIGCSLWLEPLPAAVARLAFRATWDGLPCRHYSFSIEKRGQSYKYFTFASEKEGT